MTISNIENRSLRDQLDEKKLARKAKEESPGYEAKVLLDPNEKNVEEKSDK